MRLRRQEALVGYGGGGENRKKRKTYQIEGRRQVRGLQCIFPGTISCASFAIWAFFAGAGGKFLAERNYERRRNWLLAQLAAGFVLHGDGKFGVGLAMCGKESLRICKR